MMGFVRLMVVVSIAEMCAMAAFIIWASDLPGGGPWWPAFTVIGIVIVYSLALRQMFKHDRIR